VDGGGVPGCCDQRVAAAEKPAGVGPTARANRRLSSTAAGLWLLGGIVSSRFLLAAVRCRWTLWVVVDLATFVCLWHVGGAGGQWWSLVHAASHAGLSVPPASTTMVDSCGPVRTGCGVSKRRQAHRRSDHRNSLPVAGHNLCVFDCRHLS